MNAKILVVDDQRDLLELLTMSLSAEGYIVRTAASGAEAVEAVAAAKPDLILLDILLGDTSGIKLATRWKNEAATSQIPIILLTAKDTEADIIVGLSVGADDYITKPFSTRVLLARMEAVLRRIYPEPAPTTREIVSAGSVRLFPAGRQAFVEGIPVDLTGAEFTILSALIKARGEILSREHLHKQMSPNPDGSNVRVVDVHVAALRKKLGKARNILKTVHGKGYRAVIV